MRMVFPLSATLPDQLDVSFVHQCGGLQGVIAALTAQTIRGASPKLFVHQRHQPSWCLRIAPIPLAQDLGNVGFLRNSHAIFYEYGNLGLEFLGNVGFLRNNHTNPPPAILSKNAQEKQNKCLFCIPIPATSSGTTQKK